MLLARTALSLIAFAISAPSLLLGPGLGHLVGPPVRRAHAAPAAGPIFVPYPEGLRLIAVTEGSMRGKPFVRRFDFPETWNGLPLIPYRSGRRLVGRMDAALEEDQHRLRQLRELAIQACTGVKSTHERAVLDVAFQGHIARIDAVSAAVVYQGTPLLRGAGDVYFESRGPDWVPVLHESKNLGSSALGLSGASFDVTSTSNACAVLSSIDTAIDSVLRHRATVQVLRRQVGEGAPTGGLLEIEHLLERARDLAAHAASGTLSSADRFPLDSFFQSDLERIDTIARTAEYRGLSLLDGSTEVCLEGPPPLHTPIVLELPDVTLEELRLSGASVDLTSASNASAAIVALGAACERVAEYRRELEAARASLTGETLRIR